MMMDDEQERKDRVLLRPWLENMLENQCIPGLDWYDEDKTMFKVPWKHRSKKDWSMRHSSVFLEWAKNTGRWSEGDPAPNFAQLKTRLRCAFNKAPDIEEMREHHFNKGEEPYKVYKFFARKELKSSSGKRLYHKTVVPMSIKKGHRDSPHTGVEVKYDSCEEEYTTYPFEGGVEYYLKEEGQTIPHNYEPTSVPNQFYDSSLIDTKGHMSKITFDEAHHSSAASNTYYESYEIKPSPSIFSSNIPLTVEEMTSGSTDSESDTEPGKPGSRKSEAEKVRESPTEIEHVNRVDNRINVNHHGNNSDAVPNRIVVVSTPGNIINSGGRSRLIDYRPVSRAAVIIPNEARFGSSSEVGSTASSPSDSKLNILCVASLFVEEQEMKEQEMKGGVGTANTVASERLSCIPVGEVVASPATHRDTRYSDQQPMMTAVTNQSVWNHMERSSVPGENHVIGVQRCSGTEAVDLTRQRDYISYSTAGSLSMISSHQPALSTSEPIEGDGDGELVMDLTRRHPSSESQAIDLTKKMPMSELGDTIRMRQPVVSVYGRSTIYNQQINSPCIGIATGQNASLVHPVVGQSVYEVKLEYKRKEALLVAKAKQLLEKEEKLIAWEKQLQAKQEALYWRERCLDADMSSKGLVATDILKDVMQLTSSSNLQTVKFSADAKVSLRERIASRGAVLPQVSMPPSSPIINDRLSSGCVSVRAMRHSTPPIRSILGIPSRNTSPSVRQQSVATLLRARVADSPTLSETGNRLVVSSGSVWMPSLPTHSPVALTGGWHRVNDTTTQLNQSPKTTAGVQPLVQQHTVMEMKQPHSSSSLSVRGVISSPLVNSFRSFTPSALLGRHKLPLTTRLGPAVSTGSPPSITLGPRIIPIISTEEKSYNFSTSLLSSPMIKFQQSVANQSNNVRTDAGSVAIPSSPSDDPGYPRWQQSQAIKLQSSGVVIEREITATPVAGITEPLALYSGSFAPADGSFVSIGDESVDKIKQTNVASTVSTADPAMSLSSNRLSDATDYVASRNVIPRSVTERLELISDSEPDIEVLEEDVDFIEDDAKVPISDKLTTNESDVSGRTANRIANDSCVKDGVQFEGQIEQIKYPEYISQMRGGDAPTAYPGGMTFHQWLRLKTEIVFLGETRVGASLPLSLSRFNPTLNQSPRCTMSVAPIKNSVDSLTPMVVSLTPETGDLEKSATVDDIKVVSMTDSCTTLSHHSIEKKNDDSVEKDQFDRFRSVSSVVTGGVLDKKEAIPLDKNIKRTDESVDTRNNLECRDPCIESFPSKNIKELDAKSLEKDLDCSLQIVESISDKDSEESILRIQSLMTGDPVNVKCTEYSIQNIDPLLVSGLEKLVVRIGALRDTCFNESVNNISDTSPICEQFPDDRLSSDETLSAVAYDSEHNAVNNTAHGKKRKLSVQDADSGCSSSKINCV